MSTEEHLDKIVAKCEQQIAVFECEGPALAGVYQPAIARAIASYKSNLIALKALRDMANHPLTSGIERQVAQYAVMGIRAAWPEELL